MTPSLNFLRSPHSAAVWWWGFAWLCLSQRFLLLPRPLKQHQWQSVTRINEGDWDYVFLTLFIPFNTFLIPLSKRSDCLFKEVCCHLLFSFSFPPSMKSSLICGFSLIEMQSLADLLPSLPLCLSLPCSPFLWFAFFSGTGALTLFWWVLSKIAAYTLPI